MSGAAVDILTGAPLALGFGAKRDMAAEAGELMEKVRLAGVSSSEAYRIVARQVTSVLENRIAVVLSEDPQAKVCLEILRAISAPDITAAEAARSYVRRFNPLTPALREETTPEKEV